MPDFIIRLKTEPPSHLILEVKGYNELKEIKAAAAYRWVKAVNADARHGRWAYAMANKPTEIAKLIDGAVSAGKG